MGIYDKVPVYEELYIASVSGQEFINEITAGIRSFADRHNIQVADIECHVNDEYIDLYVERNPTDKEVAQRKLAKQKADKKRLDGERKEYERLRKKFEK